VHTGFALVVKAVAGARFLFATTTCGAPPEQAGYRSNRSKMSNEKRRGEALKATIESQYRAVLNIRDNSYAHFGTAG
jgi:hypothetical protein